MARKKTSPDEASKNRAKNDATETPSTSKASKKAPTTRKTSRHVENLLAMSRSEREAFLVETPPSDLLRLFEQSFDADLVNLLLDLKKSTIKQVFEALAALRKRAIAETVTLYYYKDYLTNPLPLRVVAEDGDYVPNYYAILGVSRDATEAELKNAHRLLSRAHAPERFSPTLRKMGSERLAEIQDAFKQLNSPAKREKTDKLLPNVSYLYPRRDQSWFEATLRILD